MNRIYDALPDDINEIYRARPRRSSWATRALVFLANGYMAFAIIVALLVIPLTLLGLAIWGTLEAMK